LLATQAGLVASGLTIAATYAENESGAKLSRPELFRLLGDSRQGDILLCEQVDRLSRLTDADWKRLRAEIDHKQFSRRSTRPTDLLDAANGREGPALLHRCSCCGMRLGHKLAE
jgi:DNA invertase Pin-like site-specific DNA recombinase